MPRLSGGAAVGLANHHEPVSSQASGNVSDMSEIIFEVREAEEEGFWARALGCTIFTQGEDWEELRTMVKGNYSGRFRSLRREWATVESVTEIFEHWQAVLAQGRAVTTGASVAAGR